MGKNLNNVQKGSELNFVWSKQRLLCLQQMMVKLEELVRNAAKYSCDEELSEVRNV